MASAGERLHLLYEINRRLTTLGSLDELIRYATRRTREVFEAEGCALLLLDRPRREFYFPVASQIEARKAAQERLAETRFPADRGVAGWVLSRDEAALVADTAKDARFYPDIDRRTDMTTRSLLCAPLRTPSGNIGVIEVVNPPEAALTPEELEFLEAVANDIAVAYEKADLYHQLRGEVIGLRQACAYAGGGLITLGVLFSISLVFGHVARSLPLSELLRRPAMLGGLLTVLIGGFLLGVSRGWLVARAREPKHA